MLDKRVIYILDFLANFANLMKRSVERLLSRDNLLRQMICNQHPGVDFAHKIKVASKNPGVFVIAYYLPQFHPIPENDIAWGKGFTEWANVTRALPRFEGHYQPHLPADFGFYDLRVPDVLRAQAELARHYGLGAFCFHYYFFDGKPVMNTPIDMFVNDRTIDIGFCVNWANESWTRRWDGADDDIILKQEYSLYSEMQFADCIAAYFSDSRYIRILGRPLVLIYRPGAMPDGRASVQRLRVYFKSRYDEEPYFVMPQAFGVDDPSIFGMDAAAGFPPHRVGFETSSVVTDVKLIDPAFSGTLLSYEKMINNAAAVDSSGYKLFPGVCPSWDNEARRPSNGKAFVPISPVLFKSWFKQAVLKAMQAPAIDERIVFINAWNEWAEGAHLEPDRRFGFAFLDQIDQVFREVGTAMGEGNHGVS